MKDESVYRRIDEMNRLGLVMLENLAWCRNSRWKWSQSVVVKRMKGVRKLVAQPMRQAQDAIRGRERRSPPSNLNCAKLASYALTFFVLPRASDEELQNNGNNDSDEVVRKIFRRYRTKKLVQEEQHGRTWLV